jgi:16S rRNA (guanine527-N7)-methyltransferase
MDLGGQIDHALGFAHALEQVRGDRSGPGRWMDLGTGGGLPGLVLAQYWPGSQAVLLDSSQRRTTFLIESVRALSWGDRVQVVRARAEEAGRELQLRTSFDVVWARSFGSPPVTAECAAPFLRADGLLIVSEPPGSDPGSGPEVQDRSALRWPPQGLASLGQEPLVTVRARFGYQVIAQTTVCPDRFPRRPGVAAKRPLYRVAAG